MVFEREIALGRGLGSGQTVVAINVGRGLGSGQRVSNVYKLKKASLGNIQDKDKDKITIAVPFRNRWVGASPSMYRLAKTFGAILLGSLMPTLRE
jgi:hypothetical protein